MTDIDAALKLSIEAHRQEEEFQRVLKMSLDAPQYADDASDPELLKVLAASMQDAEPIVPKGMRRIRVRADGNCAVHSFMLIWWIQLCRKCNVFQAESLFFTMLESLGTGMSRQSRDLAEATTAIRRWLAIQWLDNDAARRYGLEMISAEERLQCAKIAGTDGAFLSDPDISIMMKFAEIHCQRTVNGGSGVPSYVGSGRHIFVPGVNIVYNGVNHYDVDIADTEVYVRYVQSLLAIFQKIATL